MLSFPAMVQDWSRVYSDTNSFAIRTAKVAGKKYIGYINDQTYYLLNSNGDTLIKKTDFYLDTEFKDFDKDGYQDIMLHHSGNTPMALDLFMYSPVTGKFKEVRNFREFPAPDRINGTNLYYSYHKSGCADMNWDSDLFYIQDFRAIKIGNIAGRQCGNSNGVKDAIYIYKVRGINRKLYKTLPISTLEKYKDFKWGFIQKYWARNYKMFM
ncbi:MAG: hypothetical protein KF746_27805 [Chitinophagaceae bacterium]|nr:hypothetical protein [Chitinophagaceae bacterium]